MSIQDLIAAEKASIEKIEPADQPVVIGGQQVMVTVTRVSPDAWANLTATHPPRPGSTDVPIGYNENTLPKDYPASHIKVEGEPVDQETWRDLYGALASVHRAAIGNAIWGRNVYPALEEMKRLGEAMAGEPSGSPARKGSRRAAGTGGNPRK